MAEIPNVCLTLAGRPENVLVVRQALAGVAESIGLDNIEKNDLVTATTEAANNVVVHAYRGEEGPLELEVFARSSALEVLIRDHGCGMGLDDASDDAVSAGIGLTVIEALASQAEFGDVPGGGTEVRMEFATPKAGTLESFGDDERHSLTQVEPTNTVEMTLAPSALARAVLPRVLTALAARAHFSTDRISDLQVVADALVANAGGSISGTHLGVGVDLAPRSMELQIGPLLEGHANRLMLDPAAAGIGGVIERLTDAQTVASDGAGEKLALRLVEPR